MRPLRLAAILALLVAAPAAASPLQAGSAAGTGGFLFQSPEAVLQAHGEGIGGWALEAARLRVTIVDDQRANEVPNPLNPPNFLFSQVNRSTQAWDFGASRLDFGDAAEPDATAIASWAPGAGAWMARVNGTFTLDVIEGQILERSHFASPNATFAQRYYYEILQGPSLRLDAGGSVSERVAGDFRIYVWGMRFGVESEGAPRSFVTGRHHEQPMTPAAVGGTSHVVHAFIDARDATLEFATAAQVYSQRFDVASAGSIRFADAAGRIPGEEGGDVEGSFLAVDGAYAWTLDDRHVGISIQQPPLILHGVARGVPTAPGAAGGWLLAAAASVAAAAYLAPTLEGLRVRRREALNARGWRALRHEGFASLAARLSAAEWHRLAALLAGWACRGMPDDPEARMEHGIMLADCGRFRRALREFQAARALMLDEGHGELVALNAFVASRASAAMRDDEAAMAWLQAAVEAQPAFGDWARRDPTLSRLRGHPDFSAVVGNAVASV